MTHRFIITGAVAVALVAGGTAAYASIPDSGGVIHGCYANKNGTLRVIDTDARQSCVKGETALTWNQAGPQGPAGPAGPQGPAGPSTAGPTGLDAEQVINETTVSYPDGTFADVQCPSDHPYVISGGGFIDDNSASMRDSYPVIPGPGGQFPQGWEVSVTFPVALGLDGRTSATVRVFAICSNLDLS